MLIAAAVLVFAIRGLDIGRTYNHTFDEPTQIVSGLEIWQYGTFAVHADVPPLAKRLMAAPAYMAGVRLDSPPRRGDWHGANRLLYDSGRYWFVLRSARAVNTVLGALLLLAIAAYAARVFGGWAAVAAALAVAASPGLVSAGSIANSDILGVLTVLGAFYTFQQLLLTGTRRAALMFALAVAAALATKLSAVPFLVFCLPVITVSTLGRQILDYARHPIATVRRAVPAALIFIAIVPLVIWSTYGFRPALAIGEQEASRLSQSVQAKAGSRVGGWVATVSSTPLPLGGFVRGVGVGYIISRLGHPAYLMGQYSLHGWPQYFLVTLVMKVPLGLWAAVLLTAALALWRWRSAAGWQTLLLLMLGVAVLASVAGAGINAGHRHVVVIEALFALVIAGGVRLALDLEQPRARQIVAGGMFALVCAGVAASAKAHPDALGYTNAMAGRDPDWWFVDSNLDWGQDLERLRQELAARGVTEEIGLAYFGTAEPRRHGIAFRPLKPNQRPCGWAAVSVTFLRGLAGSGIGYLAPEQERLGYRWLLAEPEVARIGTSLRLYRLPAAGQPSAACPPLN